MINRRKTNRDSNHSSIVADCSRVFSVFDASGVGNDLPDIIVSSQRDTVLIELKTSDGRFYLGQLYFLGSWKGRVAFAETSDDVFKIMKEPGRHCLTSTQKQLLYAFAERKKIDFMQKYPNKNWRKSRVGIKEVEQVLKIEREK